MADDDAHLMDDAGAKTCVALGCPTGARAGADLCSRHMRKLTAGLRDGLGKRGGLRSAVVHLGKLDGYLVDSPPHEVELHEVEGGQEYV